MRESIVKNFEIQNFNRIFAVQTLINKPMKYNLLQNLETLVALGELRSLNIHEAKALAIRQCSGDKQCEIDVVVQADKKYKVGKKLYTYIPNTVAKQSIGFSIIQAYSSSLEEFVGLEMNGFDLMNDLNKLNKKLK